MKLLLVLLLAAALVGCGGYGSSYNSMSGGGAPPTLTKLNPSSVAHGNAVAIVLTGTGFTSGSVVYWGTTAVAATSTTYGSTTQLTANITAAQTANTGTVMMYVHTSAGNSNQLSFMIT